MSNVLSLFHVDTKVELNQAVAMILYLYRIVVWFLTPLIFGMLLLRSIREPEYRHRISERFGLLSSELSTDCICFHTVSAGETISAAPVIQELIKQDQNLRILITTMTPTGSAMAKKIFGGGVEHSYMPYDYQFAVKRFFNRVQPKILILMETELWPNLVNEAAKRRIPVICINARLSEKSASRYKFIRPLITRLLQQVDLVACQYDGHVSRFIDLGLDPKKARALGNMKFDLSVSPNLITDAQERRKRLSLDHRLVWIVASTHDGEEEVVLTVYKKLKMKYEDLLLVLVPRHPPRSKLVGSIFEREGVKVQYESERGSLHDMDEVDILIGDVMGSLFDLYGLADIATVGGSFVDVGGHNPIEPAAYGLPILVGPYQYNFSEVMLEFETHGGLKTVKDSEDLYDVLHSLLLSKEKRQSMGKRALQTIEKNKGSTYQLVELLKSRILDSSI